MKSLIYKFKRQLPVILFTGVLFCGFLVAQISLEYVDSKALFSGNESQKLRHYESLFSKLEIQTTSKKKIKLHELTQPLVVLNFWASWCTPCLLEFPSLLKMIDKVGEKNIKVIGINADMERQLVNIRKIKKEYELDFDIVADIKSKISDTFNIEAIPVSIIFHKGKVLEISRGEKDFMDPKFLEKILSKLN